MNNRNFNILILFSILPSITGRPGFLVETAHGTSDEAEHQSESPLLRGRAPKAKLWPGGVVYYKFHNETGDFIKVKVRTAMDALKAATNSCITFQYNKSRTGVVIYKDQLNGKPGCYADVGYRPNKDQVLVLNFGKNKTKRGTCNPGRNGAGSAVHELMHTLGFLHEFQRHDRDNWIKLNKTKIKMIFNFPSDAAFENNFKKIEGDDTRGLAYNFKSILNYQLSKAITAVKNPAVKPIGELKELGQLCYISAGDRTLIDGIYYKECRGPNARPVTYNTDFVIKGTICKETTEPVLDELMNP